METTAELVELTTGPGPNGQLFNVATYTMNRRINPNSPWNVQTTQPATPYGVSEIIPIIDGKSYFLSWTAGTQSRSYRFLDDQQQAIAGGMWARNTAQVAPANAIYVQITCRWENEGQIPADLKLEEGTANSPGTQYEDVVVAINGMRLQAAVAELRSHPVQVTGATVDGTLSSVFYTIITSDATNSYTYTLNDLIEGQRYDFMVQNDSSIDIAIAFAGLDYFLGSQINLVPRTRRGIFSIILINGQLNIACAVQPEP